MTNLKKSKIFLIILCLLGLAFSYSCSCRNDKITGGDDGKKDETIKNAFTPKLNEVYNETNSVLIASKDGKQKTTLKIKFDGNGHDIKSAKATKVVDKDGNEISGTYNKDDFTLSFTQANLKTLLDKMNSFANPDTNELTITFELTTSSTDVTNTTKTIENVKAKIIKTQEFDDKAEILKGIISSLGEQSVGKRVSFTFSKDKAGLSLIELENSNSSGQSGTDNNASEFINDITSVNDVCITKNEDYKKYFDSVTNNIIGEVSGNSTKLSFTFIFTPKSIYDMALTNYTVKLDTGKGGNWNK